MIILRSEKASAKKARDHIGEIAEGWPVDVDDVRLIASELATNAIRHAVTEKIRVDAFSRDARYILEVWDADETLPTERGKSASGDGGRGLLMVGKLASRWGARRLESGGKVVFAEWVCRP